MRLRTIGLISTLALGLSAAPLPTEAQQAGKVYRIGYLTFIGGGTCTSSRSCSELRQGLRELGYVEGQNLVIEYRSAKGKTVPWQAEWMDRFGPAWSCWRRLHVCWGMALREDTFLGSRFAPIPGLTRLGPAANGLGLFQRSVPQLAPDSLRLESDVRAQSP